MLAGTILAFFATMTNLSVLYAQIESLTETVASPLASDYSQAFFSPDLCSRSSSMVVGRWRGSSGDVTARPVPSRGLARRDHVVRGELRQLLPSQRSEPRGPWLCDCHWVGCLNDVAIRHGTSGRGTTLRWSVPIAEAKAVVQGGADRDRIEIGMLADQVEVVPHGPGLPDGVVDGDKATWSKLRGVH